MLQVVLEGLKKSQVFRYISSNSQIIDTCVSQDLIVIDEECSSQGNASIIENSIIGRDFLLDVSKEGDIYNSKSSLIFGFKGPLSMGEV